MCIKRQRQACPWQDGSCGRWGVGKSAGAKAENLKGAAGVANATNVGAAGAADTADAAGAAGDSAPGGKAVAGSSTPPSASGSKSDENGEVR